MRFHRNFPRLSYSLSLRDGIKAVKEIRRLEASGELPGRNRIYALTANARSGQVQSARDAGMDDVLVRNGLLYSLITPNMITL